MPAAAGAARVSGAVEKSCPDAADYSVSAAAGRLLRLKVRSKDSTQSMDARFWKGNPRSPITGEGAPE